MSEKQEQETEEKKNKRLSKRGKLSFPHISLDEAIIVAKKVHELGGFATIPLLGDALNKKGGWLAGYISSAKRYGLIEGYGQLNLTELAKRIISPTYEGEELAAKKEAFLMVELFSKIYYRFKGKYPDENLFINILIRNYGIKNRKEAIKLINIIRKETENLLQSSNGEIETEEPNEKNLDMGKPDGFSEKISIIIKAPNVNYPFYAKNKEEFEDIVKNKLPIAIEGVMNSLKLLELNNKGEKSNEE
ncbi:MAG: hypothetical protein IIA85_02775 [Nanoarchaeota archaeon]|nr:hypothetical protein [Nanoarchaeota archaeon]